MNSKDHNPLSERTIWIWIAIVFVCVTGVLVSIYSHEKAKPDSPHALVAAAFNQMRIAQEWRPGMGPQPLIYHPAAFTMGAGEWRPGMGPQPLIYHPAGANPQTWRPLPQNNRFVKKNGPAALWP